MRKILGFALVLGTLLSAAAEAQPTDINLPDVLAVELPKGVTQIGPNDTPLRELLASARSGGRKVTSDLQGHVDVGPVKVTFTAFDGSGRQAATRTVRIFVLPNGMTPVGVSGDENATTGNNAVHIARDAAGYVHMVWQDGGRSGARTGPVYRRAALAPDGTVSLQTDPIYIADSGPSDWNAYPGLAARGHSVELVWQGGGMAYVRRVYEGPNGWTAAPS